MSDEQVLERAATWAAGRLDDGEAILIVDETADAKSSADAAGAARQYSGTLGGIALFARVRWRIEEDHQLAKQVAGLDSGQVIRWRSGHRWSAICLLAYIYLAVTAAACRASGTASDPELIPVTIPELLRLLRGQVVPQPRRDPAHRKDWSDWRRRHQYQARQAHQRWNAYADATT